MAGAEKMASAPTTTINALAEDSAAGMADTNVPMTLQNMYEAIDIDGSGSINFREFAEWWARRQTATKGRVDEDVLQVAWSQFEKHDTDDDQELSQHEFTAALEELAQSEWREAKDPNSGKSYWVNPKTRESRWDKPSIKDFLMAHGIVDLLKKKQKMQDNKVVNDSGDNMTMLLNMWRLHLKTRKKENQKFYTSFLVFVLYIVLLFSLVMGMLPLSTSLLLHQEGLIDFFLDEEFGSVENHKKSWFDVMTEPELWEWVEEPLFGAFYGDVDNTLESACGFQGPAIATVDADFLSLLAADLPDLPDLPSTVELEEALAEEGYPKCEADLPQPVLHANKPLGRIQFRTIRVRPQKCPDVMWGRRKTTGLSKEECTADQGGDWNEDDYDGTCLVKPDWVNNCAGAWNGELREATPKYYRRLMELEANVDETKGEGGEECSEPETCRSGVCSTIGVCTAPDDPDQVKWFEKWGTSYLKNCDRTAQTKNECDSEDDDSPAGSAKTETADFASPEALIDFRKSAADQGDQGDQGDQEQGETENPHNSTQWTMSSFGYSTVKGAPGMVQNLLGNTGVSDHRYGSFGYAVTLPQDRQGFRAVVCSLQGKLEMCKEEGTETCFVKKWEDNHPNAWYGLSVTDAENFPESVQEACPDPDFDPGTCQCVDDPDGVPFVDQYTRAISIGFSLWNGNDFDIDDPPLDDNPYANDKLDDHYVAFSVQILVSAGGQFEKYDRVTIIHPMRTFAWLDGAKMKYLGMSVMVMVGLMLVQELRAVLKNGVKSHFFTSQDAFWNKYECVFYYFLANAVMAIMKFESTTNDFEDDLRRLAHAGLVEHTAFELNEFKKDFRGAVKGVSFTVLISVIKIFKFLEAVPKLSFMTRIILKAKSEIFSFGIVFFLICLCFGYLASILFGYEDRLFHNWASSINSLFRLSVGALDFDYDRLKAADGLWAPLFIAAFSFVGVLVAINVFIAILSEYYDRIKEEDRQYQEDVEIFKRQGFSVPTAALLDGVSGMRDYFYMHSPLMREDEPPGLPSRVLPVHKIVACVGDFDGFSSDNKGKNPLKKLGPVLPILVLGILAGVDPLNLGDFGFSYVLYLIPTALAYCVAPAVGLCKKPKKVEPPHNWTNVYNDRIQQLVEEFNGEDGPNEDRFASNLVRLHYYSEFVPDQLRTESRRQRNIPIRGVIEHTDRGPMLRSADSFMSGSDDSPMNKMILTLGQVRDDDDEDTADDCTVVCLRLHADDMYSDVRPQVLGKMQPRFPSIKDGTPDAPFGPENLKPDTVTLSEDEFGLKFEMELLCQEQARNDDNAVFGEQKDMFALFRVVEVSSKEHFDGKSTPLHLETGGWNDTMGDGKETNVYYPTCSCDDGVLFDMIIGKTAHMSNSAMAEKFGKSEREVELRQRFLKRQCKDAYGYPITPKLLTINFQPSREVAYRMWWSAFKDKSIGTVSLRFCFYFFCKSCKVRSNKDPIIRDMKKFLRVRIQNIRDSSHSHDLPELERTFLAENMEIEDCIGNMRVYCINSGRRTTKEMEALYGRPGEEKLVNSVYGDKHSELIDVRAKIKNWLVKKHSSQLDCVIEKAIESESESDEEEMAMQQFEIQQQMVLQRQMQLSRAASGTEIMQRSSDFM